MQIFVDADACPVVGIVEKMAEKYNIPTTLLCDTNHVLYSDYSEVIVVGAGADAVDYKLISICHKGDIVVSQDYGVAAMALGKGAYAIHQSGKWYTNENIDRIISYFLALILFKKYKVPWQLCIIMAGIMLTDWSLQYFGIKESTNSRRFVTGLIGGFGLNTLKLKIL